MYPAHPKIKMPHPNQPHTNAAVFPPNPELCQVVTQTEPWALLLSPPPLVPPSTHRSGLGLPIFCLSPSPALRPQQPLVLAATDRAQQGPPEWSPSPTHPLNPNLSRQDLQSHHA